MKGFHLLGWYDSMFPLREQLVEQCDYNLGRVDKRGIPKRTKF